MKITLRNYQLDTVCDLRQAYANGFKAPLLQSPTGSGKTVIFCFITESAVKRNLRVMILVHRKELIRQSSDALYNLGIYHGIIAPRHPFTTEPVQIASVQTLVHRLDRIIPPDLVIIDECHHSAAGSWQKILNHLFDARLLGVTATPLRLDGKGLGKPEGVFDTLIEGPTMRWLIDNGYLSQPVVYVPKNDLDLSGIRRKFGDYEKKELAFRVDKPKITGSCVEHYLKICPGTPAIAFCASVVHAQHVSEAFNSAGVPSECLTGTDNDSDRQYRLDALADGRIKVLTSVEVISEGLDIPVCTTAILLRPTQSLTVYLQQVGRCLRPHPDKKCSYILDHVGNVIRRDKDGAIVSGHGFPDADRTWSLEGGGRTAKRDTEPLVNISQCLKCYAVFPLYLARCPECSSERILKPREVEEVAGELEKLTPEEIMRDKIQRRRDQGQCESLAELVELGKKRGHEPGWAYHVHKAREDKAEKEREAAEVG